jgi:uncharacterized protein YdiU (UPF0061 family)
LFFSSRNPGAYDIWAARWRSRLAVDRREPNARAKAMRAVNPAFIPRNHRVEQALDAAIDSGDFSPFADLLTIDSKLTAMGKDERAISVSGYVHRGLVKYTDRAFDKTVIL